ncbi:hypothetical protein PFISCL1PPCAC_2988, partial [Pristionchus fissidentatus]
WQEVAGGHADAARIDADDLTRRVRHQREMTHFVSNKFRHSLFTQRMHDVEVLRFITSVDFHVTASLCLNIIDEIGEFFRNLLHFLLWFHLCLDLPTRHLRHLSLRAFTRSIEAEN